MEVESVGLAKQFPNRPDGIDDGGLHTIGPKATFVLGVVDHQ